jgi:thiamine pyrophosphokinase
VGAAPEAKKILPQEGDFVIGVDGGCDYLARWGIAPDYAVGDFDSATVPPDGIACKRVAAQKNETDLELALIDALALDFRRFVFVGAGSGRPDHTFGNYQLLLRAAQAGAFAVLDLGEYSATVLMNCGSLRLEGTGNVSVFAFGGDAVGVTLTGLKYPLNAATLQCDANHGVSNELQGGSADISLARGALLVFWQNETIHPLVNI